MSDDSQTKETVETEQEDIAKQTNRTFTQSDVDKLMAKESIKIKDQYKDYDTMKGELDAMQKDKKERDLAEMTELDKAKLKTEELEGQLSQLTIKNVEYGKSVKRQRVLNDAKYNILPRVYKENVILSEDEAEIIKSADEILTEFKADTGDVVKETFGIKEPKAKNNTVVITSPEDYSKHLKSTLMERLKSR